MKHTGWSRGRIGPLSVGEGLPIAEGLVALRRSLTLSRLAIRATVLTLAVSLVVVFAGTGLGLVFLVPVVRAVRALANRQRELAQRWSGVRIPVHYEPEPAPAEGAEGFIGRLLWVIRDRQTWRDWWWLATEPIVGATLALAPIAMIVSGLWGIGMAFYGVPLSHTWDGLWYLFVPIDGEFTAILAALLGLVQLPLALWLAPKTVRRHARFTHALLAPSEHALQAQRIAHLTTTRAEAADTQAAEIRRIERDLHDGAQARLVAMGMTLGAAEHLLERDPAAVRALLVEVRESSAKALAELRDLVRGIHPPVLADRGLGDAVRSLAMISPLDVEVTVDLPERPEPPVESAAYFAISEVLTNAAKHSGADRVRIDLRYELGLLRMVVHDDGRGGADLDRGTGLRGIQRRLAAFDGVLAVHSPPNGPTVVTMQIPCTLCPPASLSGAATTGQP
ncbi:sensor histidine kinase [Embleya sp. AB8]|uniref:sensor histidine kinase n=1 Tax=Embleya sp. AB8 TaxID=3156304 RepID=UPI003C7211EC